MCLDKQYGGLGLRETRKWNDALLSKSFWNIHAKKDMFWCKWIHHFYIKQGTIWDISIRRDYPPFLKRLITIQDNLVQAEGSAAEAITRMSSWFRGGQFHTLDAYDFLGPKGHSKIWSRIMWNPSFPLKFCFFMWLAVLDRLPTMDRLPFLDLDKTCKLCGQQEENISHLFFACPFTAGIWKSIREWAGLKREISTIQSSLKWLPKENRGTSWMCTWRKLCFAATLYYLWKCRNRVVF